MSNHEDVLHRISAADCDLAREDRMALIAAAIEMGSLRLRLEEAVKKHAVCVSTIDCLQRDLGALEQRLAEVERERDEHPQHEACPKCWARLQAAFRRAEKAEQRAERAETALRPFAAFADAWDRKPIRGIHDEVYAIHAGADRGVLRLSDCKAARAALAPVAEPAKCSRCDGSGEVQCGPPSDGLIPCPKCAPVAEQPQRAGDCADCGQPVYHRPGKPGEYDHACSTWEPQPAKASTEPPDHV
jgi:hypothetical protein